MSSNSGSAEPSKQNLNHTSASQKAPGDGIKRIKTTNVFKIVNFELYAKPNMIVMTFGVVAIALSGAYLAYMKSQMKQNNTYIAIAEDGTESLMMKKSKWD